MDACESFRPVLSYLLEVNQKTKIAMTTGASGKVSRAPGGARTSCRSSGVDDRTSQSIVCRGRLLCTGAIGTLTWRPELEHTGNPGWMHETAWLIESDRQSHRPKSLLP